MRSKIYALFFALTIGVSISLPVHGKTIPKDNSWKQITTSNFIIVYKSKNKKLAQICAYYAELAHKQLSENFLEAPEKMTLVIKQSGGGANGTFSFLPYPHIIIDPELPFAEDTVYYYKNWFYSLIIHELTHSFVYAPRNGIYKPLKYVFGNIVRPTSFLPKWFHEGLAVYAESYFEQNGRLRSPMISASLRASNIDKESIDKINELYISSWPYGSRPYLFGSILLNEAINVNGEGSPKVADKWIQSYSRSLPYLLDGPVKKDLKTTWTEFYNKFREKIKNKIEEQKKRISKSEKLKKKEVFSELLPRRQKLKRIRISPNKKYTVALGTRGSLFLYNNKDGDKRKTRKLVLSRTIQNTTFSWLSDSSGFIFDNRTIDGHSIFFYEIKTQSIKLLLGGENAHHPALSPNGNKIVYIKNNSGYSEIKTLKINFSLSDANKKTKLNLLNLEKSNKNKVLFKGNIGQSLSHPQFISDQKIAFIMKNQKGNSHIYFLNISNGKLQLRFPQHTNVSQIYIPFQNSSEKLGAKINFVSSSSGVPNLYEANIFSGYSQALTNSSTAVLDGFYNKATKETYFTELTSKGSQTYKALRRDLTPPLIKPLLKIKKSKYLVKLPEAEDLKNLKEEKYNSLSYLIPRYWVPSYFVVGDYKIISGSTSVFDPTKTHNYSLSVSRDNISKKINYNLIYSNNSEQAFNIKYSKFNELIHSEIQVHNHYSLGRPFKKGPFYAEVSIVYQNSFTKTNVTGRGSDGGGGSENGGDSPNTDDHIANRSIMKFGPKLNLGYNDYYSSRSIFRKSLFVSHSFYIKSNVGKQRNALSGHFKYLISGQKIELGLKAIHVDLNRSIKQAGEKNINFKMSLNDSIVTRGYFPLSFTGTKLYNANLDLTSKLFEINKGFRTWPLFIRGIKFSIFADVLSLRGTYYVGAKRHDKSSKNYRKLYSSFGAEIILSTTMGYHLPLDLIIGYHYGLNKDIAKPSAFIVSFNIAQF